MWGLAMAAGAAAVFALGMGGLFLVRTTGLEEVPDFEPATVRKSRGGSGAVFDALGSRLMGLTTRLYGPSGLRQLEDRIRRAGRPDGLTLKVYLQRHGAICCVGLVFFGVFSVAGGALGALVGLVVAVALCLWMPTWLRTQGRRRVAQIESDLPDFLDVLGVTVQAGLGFRQAVERVCEVSTGPLVEELTTALREMALGASRRRAFVGIRDRTRSETVAAFVAALLQAEELGVPLADALEDIARDARREHGERTRQKMAKVPAKASLVISMTIVPGAVILIAAAFIIGNEVFSELF
ncbi:MAG: type II secretion system F family protein [Micrococcales bacterium]|nr:type II secretion system F family protein [Micrococcales bacterium]